MPPARACFCSASRESALLKDLLAGPPYQALRELGLHSNLLGGSVPTELGALKKLEMVGFGKNLLMGEIPTQLGLLQELWDAASGFSSFRPTGSFKLLTKIWQVSPDFPKGILEFCSDNPWCAGTISKSAS